jgi:transcriptional regulator
LNRVAAFDITDDDEIARLIPDLAFSQVVTHGSDGFVTSSLPLLLDGPGPRRLRGHVARSNPQAKIGRAEVPVVVLFVGPHAHVSPSAYATKAETGKVVPTWNYVEVHVHGTLHLTDDPERTMAVVTDLTDVLEAARAQPWQVTDAPDNHVDRSAQGILSLEVVVDRVEVKAKLSHNKSEADRLRSSRRGLTSLRSFDRQVLRSWLTV